MGKDPDCKTSGDGPAEFAAWRAPREEMNRTTENGSASNCLVETPMLNELAPPVGNALRGVPLPLRGGPIPLGGEPFALGGRVGEDRLADDAVAYYKDALPAHRTSLAAKTGNPRPIARRGRWWLVAWLLIAALFAGKAAWSPSAPRDSLPTVSAIIAKHPASQPIETIRVGQRVISQTVSAGRNRGQSSHGRLLRLRAEHRLPDGTGRPGLRGDSATTRLDPANGRACRRACPYRSPWGKWSSLADIRGTVIADEPCPRSSLAREGSCWRRRPT